LVINFKTAKQVGLTDLQRCCSGRASWSSGRWGIREGYGTKTAARHP